MDKNRLLGSGISSLMIPSLRYDFVENIVDQCIYMKVSGSKFVSLVLYVHNILLAINYVAMLHDVNNFLSINSEMKDISETSNVIRIEIFCDR